MKSEICYDWHSIVYHVIGVHLLSQSASEKHNREKSPQIFAHLVYFSTNVSAMFDNHTILLFWLWNKQTFRMFSLRDLRFLLCSFYLDVLRAQRIIGFFILITHNPTRSEIPSQMSCSTLPDWCHAFVFYGANDVIVIGPRASHPIRNTKHFVIGMRYIVNIWELSKY